MPKVDFILKILAPLRLIREFGAHINPVRLESLPFKLAKKRRIFLIDQFGVFHH